MHLLCCCTGSLRLFLFFTQIVSIAYICSGMSTPEPESSKVDSTAAAVKSESALIAKSDAPAAPPSQTTSEKPEVHERGREADAATQPQPATEQQSAQTAQAAKAALELLRAAPTELPAGCHACALPPPTDSITLPPNTRAWQRPDSAHTYVSAVLYKQHGAKDPVLIERGYNIHFRVHGRKKETRRSGRVGGIALLLHGQHTPDLSLIVVRPDNKPQSDSSKAKLKAQQVKGSDVVVDSVQTLEAAPVGRGEMDTAFALTDTWVRKTHVDRAAAARLRATVPSGPKWLRPLTPRDSTAPPHSSAPQRKPTRRRKRGQRGGLGAAPSSRSPDRDTQSDTDRETHDSTDRDTERERSRDREEERGRHGTRSLSPHRESASKDRNKDRDRERDRERDRDRDRDRKKDRDRARQRCQGSRERQRDG
jgi:hypothetical protein